jgi:hypothetical protein
MADSKNRGSEPISLDKDSILHHVFSNRTQKLTPVLKVHSNKMCVYFEGIDYKKNQSLKVTSLQNLHSEKFGGKVSDARRRKIHTIIDTWLSSMLFHVERNKLKGKEATYLPVFITLTLSSTQRHADAFIKRHMLGEFIKYVKRNCGVEHYFWRAESQSNGNIHFHLLMDKYIPKEQLQQKWNAIQSANGYLIDYYKKHGHLNAPSTDIRSPKNKNEIITYVLKYMSKDEKNRLIEGRIWGMSDSLRKVETVTMPLDEKTKSVFYAVFFNSETCVKYDDFFISLHVSGACNYKWLAGAVKDKYCQHLTDVYNYLYLGYLPTWKIDYEEDLTEWVDFETGEIFSKPNIGSLLTPNQLKFAWFGNDD